MPQVDLNIAAAEFKLRFAKHHGRQIDNSALPAGAPMYYYCGGCEKLVDTKPESWFMNPPPKYCDACQVLADHGMMDRLRGEAALECNV